MSHFNGSDYYHRRLLQSQERAARATTPEVRAIHHELAARYADLIQAVEPSGERPRMVLAMPAA